MVASTLAGSVALQILMLFGGFIIPQRKDGRISIWFDLG